MAYKLMYILNNVTHINPSVYYWLKSLDSQLHEPTEKI